MYEDLLDTCERILGHFDSEDGEYPSLQTYVDGEPVWGVVDGEVARDLLEMYELVKQLRESED
jgi:hypothetical protein